MGKQIVFLSLSGTGKSTVKSMLLATGRYNNGVTCTTRKPRDGEVDGVDYDFVPKWRYLLGCLTGWVEERTRYVGNGTLYGILRDRLMVAEEIFRPTLWILDYHGAEWLKTRFPGQVITVFLYAPKHVLRRRMMKRGDKLDDIERRLESWQEEVQVGFDHADHIIDTTTLTAEQVFNHVRLITERF